MGEIDDGLPSYMFQTTAAKSNMKTLIWIQQYPWLRRAFNGTATRSVWKIRESTLKSLRLIGSFSFKKRFVVVKQESPLDQADDIQVDAVLKHRVWQRFWKALPGWNRVYQWSTPVYSIRRMRQPPMSEALKASLLCPRKPQRQRAASA